MVEGKSEREVARYFGIHRKTVKKMCQYAVPPGYRRKKEHISPKLAGFTGIIDAILEADKQVEFTDRKRAGAQLHQLAFAVARQAQRAGRQQREIGMYQGFTIYLQTQRAFSERDLLGQLPELSLRLEATGPELECKLSDSDLGIVQSMDAQLRSLEARLAQAEQRQRQVQHRYEQVQHELSKGWEHAMRYEELRAKLLTVNASLTAAGQELEASPELAELEADALQPVTENASLHQLVAVGEIPVVVAEVALVKSEETIAEVEVVPAFPVNPGSTKCSGTSSAFTLPVLPEKRRLKRASPTAAQLHFEFIEA